MRLICLLISCSLVGQSMTAMTDQQLVYGLAKLYTKLNVMNGETMKSSIWVYFTGSMMGWHIDKNRMSSSKFRVREGLANLERAHDGTIKAHFETFNFSDPIDLEPHYDVYYNTSLSYLLLDHMQQTYQQLLVIKWAEGRAELERILLATNTDLSDIPTTNLTGYKLMADGWTYLAKLNGHAERLATELQLLSCKAELMDASVVGGHAAQFVKLQRKIVYNCLLPPKGNLFLAALNELVNTYTSNTSNRGMPFLQWCLVSRIPILSSCIGFPTPFMNPEAYDDLAPFENKTAFYIKLAEFSRQFNIHRNGLDSYLDRYFLRELHQTNQITSSDPCEIIRDSFTIIFERMGASDYASPKLEQLVTKAHEESSSAIKFDGVYDDLMDVFETCWKWPEDVQATTSGGEDVTGAGGTTWWGEETIQGGRDYT